MYDAVCDACGKDCEVPFRPTSGKPVYCSRCFEKTDSREGFGDSRSSGGRRDDYRSSGGRRDDYRSSDRDYRGGSSRDRTMYKATCDSCGSRCEVPFRPSGEKPVYCSDCFEGVEKSSSPRRSSGSSDSSSRELMEKIEALNKKLDKILNVINPPVRVKAETVEKDEVIVDSKIDENVEKEEVKEKKAKAKKATTKKSTSKKSDSKKATTKKVAKKATKKED